MYLNLDPNYFNHHKTKRLIGLLKKGSEVLPIRLWAYYAESYPKGDGRLSDHSIQEIESIASWWGTPGAMVSAMVTVKFLDQVEDGSYILHDWLDHQGHIGALKRRAEAGAAARWAKWNAEQDAKAMLVAQQEAKPDAMPPPPSPPPSLSKTREKNQKPEIEKPADRKSALELLRERTQKAGTP